jgi:alkanesulfonate monooxygenase SsuD/methylene tetrahydromethanopterin reductase-like flavin-dependent oxidoreductase (luciferase family)
VATTTRRVAIGTLVARASLRTAGLLAKQAIALDDASEGRFVLGIGTGDELSRAEHDAFGLPYLGRDVRRAHLEETVVAVRALFEGRGFAGGATTPPIAGPLLPPPRAPGGPPVWIGGISEGAVSLAARLADGWNGWGLDPATFGDRVARLRDEAGDRAVEATWGGVAVVGRDAEEAERLVAERRSRSLPHTVAGDPARVASWLEAVAAAGASWAILLAAGGAGRLEVIAERLLPRVARVRA